MKKIFLVFILTLLFLPLINADGSLQVTSSFTEEEIPKGIKIEIGHIKVINPTNEAIDVYLNAFSEEHSLPDPHWLDFSQRTLTLKPNQTKKIKMYISIPPDFSTGTYTQNIEVVGKFTHHNVSVLLSTEIKVLDDTYTIEKFDTLKQEIEILNIDLSKKDKTIEEQNATINTQKEEIKILNKKNETLKFILCGAGILALIVLLLFLKRKRTKKYLKNNSEEEV